MKKRSKKELPLIGSLSQSSQTSIQNYINKQQINMNKQNKQAMQKQGGSNHDEYWIIKNHRKSVKGIKTMIQNQYALETNNKHKIPQIDNIQIYSSARQQNIGKIRTINIKKGIYDENVIKSTPIVQEIQNSVSGKNLCISKRNSVKNIRSCSFISHKYTGKFVQIHLNARPECYDISILTKIPKKKKQIMHKDQQRQYQQHKTVKDYRSITASTKANEIISSTTNITQTDLEHGTAKSIKKIRSTSILDEVQYLRNLAIELYEEKQKSIKIKMNRV